MIRLVYGQNGSGKGLFAIRRLIQILEDGGVVYTNLAVDVDAVCSKVGCSPDNLRLFSDPVTKLSDDVRPDGWHFPSESGVYRADGLLSDQNTTLKGVPVVDCSILIDEAATVGFPRGQPKSEGVGRALDSQRHASQDITFFACGLGSNCVTTRVRELATEIVFLEDLSLKRVFGIFRLPPWIRASFGTRAGEPFDRSVIFRRDSKEMELYGTNQGVVGRRPGVISDREMRDSAATLKKRRWQFAATILILSILARAWMGMVGRKSTLFEEKEPGGRATGQFRALTSAEVEDIRKAFEGEPLESEPEIFALDPEGVIVKDRLIRVGDLYRGWILVGLAPGPQWEYAGDEK